jgi:2-iminobutanoate/2-iminopropanoate deaminase
MRTSHALTIVAFTLAAVFLFSEAPVVTGQDAGRQEAPARPRLPFTSAVRAGDTHYFAGWGSGNPETGRHPEGFDAQVRQLMTNLENLLKQHDLDFRHVVHTHAYLTYSDRFADFHRIYGEYFTGPPPALTVVGVPRLPATEVEITFVGSHRDAIDAVHPEGASRATHLSYGIRDGDYLYVSGVGSGDLRTGRLPQGGFREQAQQALENVGAILRAAGMHYRDAVKAEVFLTDLTPFETMNEVYRTFFSEDPPTRTTVGVTEIADGSPLLINLLAAPGKQVLIPEGVRASPNFSPAIRVGDRLFLSGKIGTVPGGVAAQVREVMDDLGRTLQAAGMDFSNVVEAKVYLADMNDYTAMNQTYGSYFNDNFPARSCIQAGSLLRNSTVEITLTADASARRQPLDIESQGRRSHAQ